MAGSAAASFDSRTEVEALPATSDGAPLRVLFVMPRLGFLRFFQSALELLIERGFEVRLLLESGRRDGPAEDEWLTRALEHPNFRCDTADHLRGDPLREGRIGLRLAMEYVRRLGSAYVDRVAARPPRLADAPRLICTLAGLPLVRTERGLRAAYGALAAIDRALPLQPAAARYVADVDPDVVAICDKGQPGSLSSAYVRAAMSRGIPTALCVASWDNLTNRQRIPVAPHALLVWNEHQRREAVEFHGIPSDRVVTTGAPKFDEWFDWRPRSREEFLGRLGLDPERPLILWIGCALNPADTTEAEFVRRWIGELRRSDDPLLREASVLARPHPERLQDWLLTDFSDLRDVALWPREGMTFPIGVEAKADYYDSIFHARAAVGINTSAMIEAAIVGRPVFTVLVPEFHDSQLATFHFSYLLDRDGGPVRVAATMEEHVADLSRALAAGPDAVPEEVRRFVSQFVRPHGLDRSATDVFVDRLVELAAGEIEPTRPAPARRLVRPLASTLLEIDRGLRAWQRLRRRVRKQLRLRRRLRRAGALARRPISRALKLPARERLRRAGVLELLQELRRDLPARAHARDYRDLWFLYRTVRERRPEVVLELGGGWSTVVLAAALRDNGGGVLWSVERDAALARTTLPEPLRQHVTVVHAPAVEDDRGVPGRSYADVPDVAPGLVYLDCTSPSSDGRVAFDVLDLEPSPSAGFVLVLDGAREQADRLRERLGGTYRLTEHRLGWHHLNRYTLELLEPAS